MTYGNGGYNPGGQQIGVALATGQFVQAGPPPINSVLVEMSTADKRDELLHSIISELANRLGPVLRPDAPSGMGNGPSAPQSSAASTVVERLRAHGQTVDAAILLLQNLIGRIEL